MDLSRLNRAYFCILAFSTVSLVVPKKGLAVLGWNGQEVNHTLPRYHGEYFKGLSVKVGVANLDLSRKAAEHVGKLLNRSAGLAWINDNYHIFSCPVE